jgi:hypothetical protein
MDGMLSVILQIATLVAFLTWVILAVRGALHHRNLRSRLAEPLDVPLAAATILLVVLWAALFGPHAWSAFREEGGVPAAISASAPLKGSCISVRVGMGGAQVREMLGTPDRVLNDEDRRGPGAEQWVFHRARCSVHVVGDRVEFFE